MEAEDGIITEGGRYQKAEYFLNIHPLSLAISGRRVRLACRVSHLLAVHTMFETTGRVAELASSPMVAARLSLWCCDRAGNSEDQA